MASPSENEYFGNLSLKRSKRSKTGYWGVYGPNDKCTEKPYQAFIKNKRTNKQQAVGSFATAKEAAIHLAKMLALEEDDDLESPRKQAKRGSVKAEKEVKAAVLGENSTPQTHPMPNKFFSVPIATPSFLSQEELSMRAARGLVGSVACVLDA
eukprot:CAMPEP_0181168374 /NCGR_PEP_ID=MMETSP1096-20121128/236_1 /TAXON_ID=156174 ORGANISM="Chrysochromulina ericina, Strain CCMP281" /NCGR_SAMPLE_ID=MMETSP1096 /ASSEMBLY_ACC=CAM_ASM_000453 /LENGTH=152 /DNA_ID=CAMNT_0023255739 /DNA_START=115 /DNA_END=573 /DNA_ORIENTATION=+